MRILFWNTHNNTEINPILNELIIENKISIVVLAEYNADILQLISNLANNGIEMKQYITLGESRIKIIGDITDVIPGIQNKYYSLQIIRKKYILCCIHLPSQIYTKNEEARRIIIKRIITDIEKAEDDNSTENTIIVGDLNINPFDHGCIDAELFHSLPYYEVAKKKSRIVADESFKMFYNPMWNILGDFCEPYGTYYYNGSNGDNIFWHTYDQVMIRPVLRESFIDDSLKIITETHYFGLLNINGHPDKKISDHLPLIFEIKEK